LLENSFNIWIGQFPSNGVKNSNGSKRFWELSPMNKRGRSGLLNHNYGDNKYKRCIVREGWVMFCLDDFRSRVHNFNVDQARKCLSRMIQDNFLLQFPNDVFKVVRG